MAFATDVVLIASMAIYFCNSRIESHGSQSSKNTKDIETYLFYVQIISLVIKIFEIKYENNIKFDRILLFYLFDL